MMFSDSELASCTFSSYRCCTPCERLFTASLARALFFCFPVSFYSGLLASLPAAATHAFHGEHVSPAAELLRGAVRGKGIGNSDAHPEGQSAAAAPSCLYLISPFEVQYQVPGIHFFGGKIW